MSHASRLTRRFRPRHMHSVLAAMKVRGVSVYSSIDPGHPMPDAFTGMERRHRGLSGGGNLRAAVFTLPGSYPNIACLWLETGVRGGWLRAGGQFHWVYRSLAISPSRSRAMRRY